MQSTIPKPGTPGGPCEKCQHPPCMMKRKTARSFCAVCDRSILYDTPFVFNPSLMHETCVGKNSQIAEARATDEPDAKWFEAWLLELYERSSETILKTLECKSKLEADDLERRLRLKMRHGGYGIRVRRKFNK